MAGSRSATGAAAAAGGEKIRIAVTAEAITLGGVSAAAAPVPGGKRRLRVFVDRTLVEVFVDGRTAITQEVPCVAPQGAVTIVAAGPPLRLDRVDAWALAPIWQEEDREHSHPRR